jgi:hypothetical protein
VRGRKHIMAYNSVFKAIYIYISYQSWSSLATSRTPYCARCSSIVDGAMSEASGPAAVCSPILSILFNRSSGHGSTLSHIS